jgi:DNA mismatch endonuclease Vsr
MQRVRTAGTSAENEVAKTCRKLGLSYRRNVRSLPGSPDFANKSYGWVIFVNGCFWHAHSGCRKATVPKRNNEFWTSKFKANRRRDAKKIRELRALGYRVLIVWECQAFGVDLPPRLSNLRKSRVV